MSWVRFDDGFLRHPKVLAAGRDARDLHIAGIFYCAAGLTDGFIMAEALPLIAVDAGVGSPKKLVERLLAVGLWERAQGGYRVHDYLEYQPSRADALALKAARSEAGRRGGQNSAAKRQGGGDGQGDGGDHGALGGPPVTPPKPPRGQANPEAIASAGAPASGQAAAQPNGKQNRTPTRPDPIPVPDTVSTPSVYNPTDLTDGGCGGTTDGPQGDESVGRSVDREPGGEGRMTHAEARQVVEDALAAHPHWRPVLDAEEAKVKPAKAVWWRLGVVQNWLAGDGTPEAPKPKRPATAAAPAKPAENAAAYEPVERPAEAPAGGVSDAQARVLKLLEELPSRRSLDPEKRNPTRGPVAALRAENDREARQREREAVDAALERLQADSGLWAALVAEAEAAMPAELTERKGDEKFGRIYADGLRSEIREIVTARVRCEQGQVPGHSSPNEACQPEREAVAA